MSQTKAQLIEGLNINTSAPADALVIDSSGNVGIGDTSPSAQLEIRGASTVGTNTGHIVLSGDSATVGQGPQITFSESGSGSSVAGAYIGHGREGSNSIGFLSFGTRSSSDANDTPAERMRIISSGRVGIGTSSPASLLNISASSGGDTSGLRITRTDSGGGDWRIWSSATANGEGAGKLIFANSGNRVAIDGSGNVGIGTMSPSARLHANSGSTDVVADFESSDANAWIQIRDNSTTDTAVMVGAVGDDMRLRAGSNERVRIDSSGRVGIGTTGPTGSLSIASGTFQTTTPTSTGDDIVISGNQSLGIQFLTLASGTSNNNIYFGDTDDPDVGMIRYAHANNSLQFQTNASERLRIDSSGNVGIGTASPAALCHISKTSGTTLYRASVAGNSTIGFEIVKTGATTQSWRIADGQTVNGKLEFYDVTDSATRMCIDGSGNVGFGTTSPNHRVTLHNSGTGTFDAFNITSGLTNSNGLQLGIDSASNVFFWHTANGAIRFATNNAERVRVTNNGLTFNGDTAAANALSDYEEGTFTPSTVLTYNPGGRSITDNGTGTGKYVKVGKIVYCEFSTGYTAISGSGNFNVGVNGLPFSADTTLRATGGAGRSNINGYMFILEDVNTTQVGVLRRYDNGGPVDGADNFVCHLTYITT